MLRLVVRRLLLLVPILLGVSILVFLWIRALPGSPAEALLGERATPEAVARVRHQYGLDDPLPVQYWRYLVETVGHQNLGTSIATYRPVTYEIGHRFPATVELALTAMLFATFLCVPLGFLAARKYGSVFDHGSLVASLIGISIPIFFLGLILKYIFSVRLGWLPSIGREDVLADREHPTNFYVLDAIIERDPAALQDAIRHLILPAIALATIPLAIVARITRAAVLDVQN
jgi:peptide/nickel transport system permease protein